MVLTLALETLLAKSPGNENFDGECISRSLMVPAAVSEDGVVGESGGKALAMVGKIYENLCDEIVVVGFGRYCCWY